MIQKQLSFWEFSAISSWRHLYIHSWKMQLMLQQVSISFQIWKYLFSFKKSLPNHLYNFPPSRELMIDLCSVWSMKKCVAIHSWRHDKSFLEEDEESKFTKLLILVLNLITFMLVWSWLHLCWLGLFVTRCFCGFAPACYLINYLTFSCTILLYYSFIHVVHTFTNQKKISRLTICSNYAKGIILWTYPLW